MKSQEASTKFCVNCLMHNFLIPLGSRKKTELSLVQDSRFIIVESNFKVYAYTSSPLYQAILQLFMREDYRFPNLVVGMLTRESLKEAFKK